MDYSNSNLLDERKYISIFDTTLRDGEQAPGNTMFDWEKIEIAKGLANAGVDTIEAGFPAASPGDFNSVKNVAEKLIESYGEKSPNIAALAMTKPENIIAAGEALSEAIKCGKGRIHTFIASSEIHASGKLRKSSAEILNMAVGAIKLAREYTKDVEFSPEDASRTGIEFLLEISEATAKAGARTINIPDTVGYAVPEEFGQTIRKVVEKVSKYGAIVSAHCHNDLGNATANSLAALMNGARQVECTINGIGERAGNASLEQIVMNILLREDYYSKKDIATKFNPTKIGYLSRLVSMATGSWPSANSPLVGANAFSHQAGIHQDGVIKNAKCYEIMKPEDVDWVGEKYVVGKHSGKAGVSAYLSELGFDNVDSEIVLKIRADIKKIADAHKQVFDGNVRDIASNYNLKPRRPTIKINLDNISYSKNSNSNITLPVSWEELETRIEGIGESPISTAYQTIKNYVGKEIRLVGFKIAAVGEGERAIGETRVTIEKNGKMYVARGGHKDIILSAISAYVNAINRGLVDN